MIPRAVVLGCAVLFAGAALAQPRQPTREAIAAFIDASIAANEPMDLIAEFGADFRGLDLHGLRLKGVHAVRMETNLAGADFTDADLREADFGASVLRGARFTRARMAGASFVTADLSGADFREASMAGCRFQECVFRDANLSGLALDEVDFGSYGHRMRGVDLSGSSLRGRELSGDLTGADLTGADLRDADLRYGRFAGARLSGARLGGAQVHGADFREALGLSEAERARLVAESGIEAIEARRLRERLVRGLQGPAYGALVLLTAYLAFAASGSGAPGAAWRVRLALAADAVVAVGPGLLLVMALIGGSSTAQLTGSVALWQLWFLAWPVLLLAIPCAAFVLLSTLVSAVAARPEVTWSEVGFHASSLLTAAATWLVVLAHFPDA